MTVQTKVEALLLLGKIDERKRPLFYEALLDAHLYVPGTLETEEGAAEGMMKLRYFQGNGGWVLPIFTKLSYVQAAFPNEMNVLTVRGKELFERVDKEATVVLNIETDVSKTFSKEEIRDIVTGAIFQ